jgi:hypothetical protein
MKFVNFFSELKNDKKVIYFLIGKSNKLPRIKYGVINV